MKRGGRARPVRRPPARDEAPQPRGEGGRGWERVARDVAILAAVVGVTVGIAELAGAANLGVAFGIGQIVFVIALVALLTRG